MTVDRPHQLLKVLDASRFRSGTDADKRAFADELRQALTQNGFVKLINHGITADMVREVMSIVRLYLFP